MSNEQAEQSNYSGELHKQLKRIERDLWTMEAVLEGHPILDTFVWKDNLARISALSELVKQIQTGEPSWVLHALRKEGM